MIKEGWSKIGGKERRLRGGYWFIEVWVFIIGVVVFLLGFVMF